MPAHLRGRPRSARSNRTACWSAASAARRAMIAGQRDQSTGDRVPRV